MITGHTQMWRVLIEVYAERPNIYCSLNIFQLPYIFTNFNPLFSSNNSGQMLSLHLPEYDSIVGTSP